MRCFFSMLTLFLIFFGCSDEGEDRETTKGKILFSADLDPSKQPQIYLMDDDGSNMERITNGHGYYQSAQWSRNKDYMAVFSEGGSSDEMCLDCETIFLMDDKGTFIDSVCGGFYEDGRFVWLGESLDICYPQTLIGVFRGYYIADYPWENDFLHHERVVIQHDSSAEAMQVFDCHPDDETRLLCKYKMKERVLVRDKYVIRYYWNFGEMSTSGEILKVYFRLNERNVMNAKYSPDGEKIAYAPDANTITIMKISKPERAFSVSFSAEAGYMVNSFLWSPNSKDLALSLNQKPLSGIYLYKTGEMELVPIVESDTATYFIGDYRLFD